MLQLWGTFMRALLPTDLEFQIPMQGNYVSLVRKGIRSLAAEEGYTESDCEDIEIAVGEAVTNAISYGKPKCGQGRVRIHCRITPSYLIIEVEDEGRTSCVPLPKPSIGTRSEHGRGWMIIHRLMDRVSVRCTDRGMLVRMVKQRRRLRRAASRSLWKLAVVA